MLFIILNLLLFIIADIPRKLIPIYEVSKNKNKIYSRSAAVVFYISTDGILRAVIEQIVGIIDVLKLNE